jgi:hypothetical protein
MKKTLKITLALFLILLSSCEDEKYEAAPEETKDIIKKSNPIYDLLETVVNAEGDPVNSAVCVKFIYSFQLLVYNQNDQVVNQITMSSNSQFSNLLQNLPTGQSISISYPIQTLFPDGTIFSVTNNEQLKMALNQCSKENLLEYCKGIFGNSGPCSWKIPFIDEQNNEYAGGVFTANESGTINFYHLNQNYLGTWTFLIVGNNLYLNINLEGNSNVSNYWNHNYEIIALSDIEIKIKSNNIIKTMVKNCGTLENYEIGDVGPKGGIIGYKKSEYSNGWKYIEVATNDIVTEEWGCMNTSITNAEFNQIGTGLQNNYAIITKHNTLNNYYLNPSVCSNLNNGTLASKTAINSMLNNSKDWFIPSFNELKIIYTNLNNNSLVNFEHYNYWTSTENGTQQAKTINLQTGIESLTNKNSNNIKTRVIRYF